MNNLLKIIGNKINEYFQDTLTLHPENSVRAGLRSYQSQKEFEIACKKYQRQLKLYLDRKIPDWEDVSFKNIDTLRFQQCLTVVSRTGILSKNLEGYGENYPVKLLYSTEEVCNKIEKFMHPNIVRFFLQDLKNFYFIEQIKREEKNAYSFVEKKIICVFRYGSILTHIHELAHLFEREGNKCCFKVKANMYLKYRCPTGETRKINCENGKEVKIYISNFINQYTGRVYSDKGTEIFSVGIENLIYSLRSLKFAREDFDYFSFVIGCLNGAI